MIPEDSETVYRYQQTTNEENMKLLSPRRGHLTCATEYFFVTLSRDCFINFEGEVSDHSNYYNALS